MISEKEITFYVFKSEGYGSIGRRERRRIEKFVSKRIFELAGRFDGSSKFTLQIKAKGNA